MRLRQDENGWTAGPAAIETRVVRAIRQEPPQLRSKRLLC